jgi:hypothetical protein
MTALAGIAHLTLCKDRCLGGLVCVSGLPIAPYSLAGGEATYCHRGVPPMAQAAQAGQDPRAV